MPKCACGGQSLPLERCGEIYVTDPHYRLTGEVLYELTCGACGNAVGGTSAEQCEQRWADVQKDWRKRRSRDATMEYLDKQRKTG